jgi:hypothetical protein
MFRRFLAAGIPAALGLVLLVSSSPASAARTTTSSIALHQPSAAAVAQWQPALGTLVTFDVAYPTSAKNVRIEVRCFQNGTLVYGEAGSADQTVQQQLTGSPGFVLGGAPAINGFSGGSIWANVGGAADCTANLFYFGSKAGQQTYNLLATTQFAAA